MSERPTPGQLFDVPPGSFSQGRKPPPRLPARPAIVRLPVSAAVTQVEVEYASVNVGGMGGYRPLEVTEYASSVLAAAEQGRALPAERQPKSPPAPVDGRPQQLNLSGYLYKRVHDGSL